MILADNLKTELIRNLSNLPGWRTNRKIIVFESDDWGSVRMPSLTAFQYLESKGLDLSGGDAYRYNQNDTLESSVDLEALFNVICPYKDQRNRPFVITAVSVVANPDFQKIKENNFSTYFCETFCTTSEKYYGNTKSFSLWKEGIENKIFIPQFHAREHLNISEWMRSLQANDKQTLLAFEQGVWGFNNKSNSKPGISFQAAFDLFDPADILIHAETIKDGLVRFEKLFGYKSVFFVPPNGPFNRRLEKTTAESGVKYISTSKIQTEPQGYGKNKTILHWLGQKNKLQQTYLTRNCFFEPSSYGKDWIGSCISEIETAFRWNKPAIISSHRVNYIGALREANRKNGLSQLEQLLKKILHQWPDVEFCSSDELGDLINKSLK